MKRIIHDTFSEPRNIALTSVLLIALTYFLSVIAPEDATIEQIENWTSIGMIGTIAYLIISSALVHRTIIQTYIFFLACTALFVSGRYIAHAMGFDLSILNMETNFFSVHRPDFVIIDLNTKEALQLSTYIITCLFSIHAGYMFTIRKNQNIKPSNLEWTSTLKFPAIALSLVSVITFAVSFPEAYRIVHSDGYASMYQAAGDFTTRGSTAAQYGLLLSLGLAIASRTKWLSWCVLGLLAIYYVANLKLGIRGGIMGFALLCIWIFHTQVRRIDKIALVGVPILLGAILLYSALGPRNFHFGENTSVFLPWFIDNQGLTALYIYASTQIDAYPALAYFHSIIPAAPTVASIFGLSVPLDQLYFGQYLSKATMAGSAYQNGFGMGWSVLSDFYAYTLWVPGLYLVAAVGFGAALSKLVNSVNPLVFGAHVMLFVKIMLLPRTGLYSIIPFVIAYTGIVVACYLFSRFLRRKSALSHN